MLKTSQQVPSMINKEIHTQKHHSQRTEFKDSEISKEAREVILLIVNTEANNVNSGKCHIKNKKHLRHLAL